MTRFARVKGSKSSNLKEPDDSTPWEVMKEQLLQAKKESEDSKNREQAENQRIENYSNFLKEQKVQKRKATWCDFPETGGNKKSVDSTPDQHTPKKKKKSKNLNVDDNSKPADDINNAQELTERENVTEKTKGKKKNKNKAEVIPSDEKPNSEEANVKVIQNESAEKKVKKKKNKKLKQDMSSGNTDTNPEVSDNINQQVASDQNVMQKNNQNNMQKNNQNGMQKKKAKKRRGDKPARRKEINDRSFQLIINGKEVELMRFDGFPIMKKDADRLSELKSSMMKKGIPKTEVNRTIKLERRRAEKALARLKRDVCYNCRKGGHNLSDCPDLKSNIPGVDAAEGVCFKCGSTEHRQFECKVQRDKEFRFANCFICKEQGHIARQCPDNPKGLYPNGGCCKLCGDVTHLRKDCPTVQNKNESTSIKLQTLDIGNYIEDIELQSKPVSEEAPKKPKKIKF